jgi:hypothetical protein
MSFIPRQNPDDVCALTGEQVNKISDAIDLLLGIDASPPLYVNKDNGSILIFGQSVPSKGIPATITGPLGAGNYTLNLIGGATVNGNPNGNLTIPGTGETTGNTTAIGENVAEIRTGGGNASTNWIGNGTLVMVTPTGCTGNLSGNTTPVYRFESWNGKTGNATTLPTGGNVSSVTADTGNWSISGNNTPLTFTEMTRVVWDSGNTTLWGFTRNKTIDGAGREISWSGETRVNINTASNGCSGNGTGASLSSAYGY